MNIFWQQNILQNETATDQQVANHGDLPGETIHQHYSSSQQHFLACTLETPCDVCIAIVARVLSVMG